MTTSAGADLGARGRTGGGVPAALRALLDVSRLAEPVITFAGVLLAGLVAFGTHLMHGGYYLDDWRALEMSRHLGPGGVADSFARQWDYGSFRPVSALYRWGVWDSPLGPHPHWNLAFALLMAAVMSTLLALVMRRLGFAWLDGFVVAVLVVVCPLADSTRLWVSASPASVNIALYLGGLLLALRGLRAGDRGAQVRWHAAAAALYLASVLFAESTAALVVATALLYWLLAGRRAALARTAIDTPLAALAAWWISRHDTLTPRTATSLSALWDRAESFAREAPSVFAQVLDPYGGRRGFAIAAVLVLAAGLAVLWRAAGAERDELQRWLLAALAGVVVAASGWAIYLPADAYYRPEQQGIGNRLNAVAAVGLVLVAWSAVRVAVLLAGRARPGLVRPVLVAAAVVIGLGAVSDSRADARAWNTAFARERTTLDFVRSSIPAPPPGSMIYVVRQTQYLRSELPIFVAWDFRPALRYAYGGAPGVRGWAIPWSVPFHCRGGVIYPREWGWSQRQGAGYGNTWVVDVATRQVWHVADRASCERAARAVKALPMTRWVESVKNFPDQPG